MKSSLAELQPWISGAVVVNTTGEAAFDGRPTDSRPVTHGHLVRALTELAFHAHRLPNHIAPQKAAPAADSMAMVTKVKE